MRVIHTLRMDLARCGGRPTVAAVQGEANTRVLEVSLYDNSIGWEIPAAAVVDIAYQKPDGTKGIYSKLPDGTPATTFSGNVLTAILAPQVLTCAGTIRAAFVFSKEGTETLATFPFTITVEANPAAGAERSEDYFNPKDLSDLRAEMATQATDLRAEIAAHAADTQNPHGVTAEQAGAAPAGYGLGEQNSRSMNNWGEARNSFQRGNTGSPDGEWWHGIICKEYGNVTTNLAFKPNNGVWLSAMRGRTSDGTWGKWEYVNPPMLESVEYRTTERFNGRPVYAQLFNCGTLPNAFYKEYTVTSATKANILDIVRLDGYISIIGSTEKVPIWVVSDVDFRFYGNNRLRITTTGDKSYLSAYVAVYYTLSE